MEKQHLRVVAAALIYNGRLFSAAITVTIRGSGNSPAEKSKKGKRMKKP